MVSSYSHEGYNDGVMSQQIGLKVGCGLWILGDGKKNEPFDSLLRELDLNTWREIGEHPTQAMVCFLVETVTEYCRRELLNSSSIL
jgi:hypothetical protein